LSVLDTEFKLRPTAQCVSPAMCPWEHIPANSYSQAALLIPTCLLHSLPDPVIRSLSQSQSQLGQKQLLCFSDNNHFFKERKHSFRKSFTVPIVAQ